MFLLRAAFWLSVVILLIPADPQTGTEAPRVSAIETLVAARATIADMSSFCDRNPSVCVTGHSVARLFVDKAEYGARLLYQYLDKAKGEAAAQGTLTGEDLAPGWQTPKSGRAA
jgi:hypothetical protein